RLTTIARPPASTRHTSPETPPESGVHTCAPAIPRRSTKARRSESSGGMILNRRRAARLALNGAMIVALEKLTAGMPIVFGGDKLTFVSADLAERFAPGDRLIVVQESGALLHAPRAVRAIAAAAVDCASEAFVALAQVSDAAI